MKKIGFAFLLIFISSNVWGAQVGNYPSKTSPVLTDNAVVVDSEDGNKLKNVPLTNIPISTPMQTALNTKANIADMSPLSTDMQAFLETANDAAALIELGAQSSITISTDCSTYITENQICLEIP